MFRLPTLVFRRVQVPKAWLANIFAHPERLGIYCFPCMPVGYDSWQQGQISTNGNFKGGIREGFSGKPLCSSAFCRHCSEVMEPIGNILENPLFFPSF